MILSSLRVENFKKYRSYSIEFRDGLTGIIGKNGSGKSTIFEAIVYALYGEFKRKRKDSLKNVDASSKDHVLIELEFELNSATYIVKREFRGKNLNAVASLYKNGELIASSTKEVNLYILKITKMSKDSFLHTVFASQKELNNLTLLKNEDRKKMIRKLLGLEKIDFIENEVIQKSRDIKRDIANFSEFLLSNDELKLKEQTLTTLQTEKEKLTKELNRSKLEKLEQTLKELNSKNLKYQEQKEQKQAIKNKIDILINSINNNKDKKNRLEDELKELKLIFDELKELENIKDEFKSLEDSLKNMQLLKEKSIQKDALLKEQESLRESYKKLQYEIKTLKVEYEKSIDLTNAKDNLINKIEILKKDIANLKDQQNHIEQSLAIEQNIINDATKHINQIKSLGKESACPVCTRALLDEYDNVLNSFYKQIEDIQTNKISTLKSQKDSLIKEIKAKELILKQDESSLQNILNQIAIMQKILKDIETKTDEFKYVKQKGLDNQEKLNELKDLEYNKELHLRLENEYIDKKAKYEKFLKLETKLQREPLVKSEIKQLVENIDRLNLELKAKNSELKSIKYNEKEHKKLHLKIEDLQIQKDKEIEHLNSLEVKIANYNGEIKSLENDLTKNKQQMQKLATMKQNLIEYEKIKLSLISFKTKLNSKITPQISHNASILYSQITNGKYQHIEVDDDFNFFIYDNGKKFPIDRFSGGEIDLANLVLRISISKTLNTLNGSSNIGFLAFDEIFGSQDEQRRLQILEAFHTIKEQYRQIFLISHEVEIKEMFETVIEL